MFLEIPTPTAYNFYMALLKKIKSLLKVRKLVLAIIIIGLIGTIAYTQFFPKPAPRQSTQVKRGNLVSELTLSGKIEADEHSILQFQAGGQLAWVGVKEGDWVKKNQAVASLDKEQLMAALRKAQQDFTAAKAASEKVYDSLKTVAAENFDQKVSRTAADATQNKAYDSIRIAEEDLRYSVLYSPIEGLVTRVDAPYAGVNVYLPSGAQFEIVNPKTIYLDVTADQTEVIDLVQGKEGTIVFDSYPEEKINGRIKNIAFTPKKDETGTVYRIKVEFNGTDNSTYRHKIGMTGDVTFETQRKENVLYLPITFVQNDDSGKFVYKGKNREKVKVETGLETDKNIEIKSGLAENDTVYD